VNRVRVRGIARRLRQGALTRLTTRPRTRRRGRLQAGDLAHRHPIEAMAVARGVVELRGWVPTRAARTIAGRTALAAPGIESVINSLQVRGEDDTRSPEGSRATDQSA
jgi:osmotically-inducible protein OsmY